MIPVLQVRNPVCGLKLSWDRPCKCATFTWITYVKKRCDVVCCLCANHATYNYLNWNKISFLKTNEAGLDKVPQVTGLSQENALFCFWPNMWDLELCDQSVAGADCKLRRLNKISPGASHVPYHKAIVSFCKRYCGVLFVTPYLQPSYLQLLLELYRTYMQMEYISVSHNISQLQKILEYSVGKTNM